MKQAAVELEVATRGKGLYEVTDSVNEWVRGQAMQTGLLTVFVVIRRHRYSSRRTRIPPSRVLRPAGTRDGPTFTTTKAQTTWPHT